jgi:DNA mismatch repair ATPase MutS
MPFRSTAHHHDGDFDEDDEQQAMQTNGADEVAAAPNNLTEGDSIVAVAENRRYEIGMATLRLSTYQVELSSFCDDQAYSKTLSALASVEPARILFPSTAAGTLLPRISEINFELAHVSFPARKSWNASKGMTYVRQYAHRAQVDVLEKDLSSKFLCLSALAALLDDAEKVERTSFVKGALAFKVVPVDGSA